MFVRIRCYLKMLKAEMIIRNSLQLAEINHDEKWKQTCMNALQAHQRIKKQILANRQIAKQYISDVSKLSF